MSVNSITAGNATFKLPTFNSTAPAKQPVKDAAKTVDATNVQESPPKVLDAKQPAPASLASAKPARGMSHMVESYDSSGKVVTKYVDSSNDVIYQTPSEMVLKTQELMTSTQAATDVKG